MESASRIHPILTTGLIGAVMFAFTVMVHCMDCPPPMVPYCALLGFTYVAVIATGPRAALLKVASALAWIVYLWLNLDGRI